MLKNISLGVYYPGNSLIHRLQARTKLLTMLLLLIALFIANRRMWHFAPYAALLLLVVAGMACAGISPYEVWRRIWLLVVFLVLGAIPLFTFREAKTTPLLVLGPLLLSHGLARNFLLAGGILVTTLVLTQILPRTRAIWRTRILKHMGPPLWVLTLLIFLLYWLLAGPPALQPVAVGPYTVTYTGVWLVVTTSSVLLIFYCLSMLITMTTSPVKLVEGLTILIAPLRHLKFPINDFALMVLIALRFAPTLLEEAEQLMKAQASRGADITSGTLRERLQSIVMLFVPLMNGFLRRAAELATALEARGYEVEGRQTFLHETTFGPSDYSVLAVVVVVMAGSFLL